MQIRPDDGDLILHAAESFRLAGDASRGAALLSSAKKLVRPAKWLRNAGRDAISRADLPEAIRCYRKVLETEPASRDVHASLATLLCGTDGMETAIRHLEETCQRYPGNIGLHSLLCE